MPLYVDGFLLPVPKKKIDAYKRFSRKAGKIWREHGALEYRECVGDDMKIKGVVPFPRRAAAKPGDAVVFSWITYRSRKHRDQVNAKVMADPRVARMAKESAPFDMKRMAYGGFQVLVDV